MRKLLFIIGIFTFFLSSCGSTLEVTVNFESNGGTQIPSQVFNEESVFTLPDAPTKEGHTFLGWFLDDTFDTPFSVEGILALEPENTLTLYASWQVNQYTITFDTDGGTEVSAISQDYSTSITAPTNPTKEGYTFSGWSASIPTTMPAENTTLTATWTINSYTITFDSDGGSIVNELTFDYGTEISLLETPTKENFIFMGWSPVIPNTMPATNLTVKALWEYDPEIVGSSPVYQGMDVASVSTSQASFPLSFRSYRETTFTSGINDEIPTIDIPEQPDFTYYANPNEVILVRVYLTNPDSQVILRFKLNGVIYQSFEFQEGSNSELLIVKVNAGAISGTKELTIDEIKYVENVSNEIKDAVFEGERTIQMGVTYQYPLEAVISNELITATSYQSTITITDTDDLISVYENPPVFYLFDGSSIVYTQILNVGSNTIEYQQLKTDQSFEYAIAMTYDLLDGEGVNAYITLQNVKRTEKIVEITSVISTQTSLAFELDINDQENVGEVTAIELYQGETLVESFTDLTLRTFDNLLSYNSYEIKVTYTYNLNDGVGDQTYNNQETSTTLAKATPSVEVTNIVPTQESIVFELDITDTDQVGEVTSIELYQGEILIEALTDLTARTFDNLLSNNTYEVKVTYTYDLNDGMGEQIYYNQKTSTTIAKAIPKVEITDIVLFQESITFELWIKDIDQVAEITAIELYKGETLIESLSDLSLRRFNNLLSNNDYEIKVTYTYDLNDGLGLKNLSSAVSTNTLYDSPRVLLFESDRLTVVDQEFINIVIEIENPNEYYITNLYINSEEIDIYEVNSTNTVISFVIKVDAKNLLTYEIMLNQINFFVNGQINEGFYSENTVIILDVIQKLNVLNTSNTSNSNIFESDNNNYNFNVKIEIFNPFDYEISKIGYKFNLYDNNISYVESNNITIDENGFLIFNVEYNGSGQIFFHIYSLEYIVNNIKYLEINYSPDNETNAIITNIGWSMRLSFINTNNLIYISTRNELKNISGFANYKLVNDIDLLEIPWEPLDIQYFTFNGNGKTIKGLNIIQDTFIETSEQNKFYGLFGYIENSATIYDLTLEGNIEVDENSENYFTDIRVGLLLGDGYNIVLENINVIGTINANGDAFRVGLVFGNIGNGSINNLESSGSINIIGINSSMIGSIGGYISFTNINSSILKSSSDITFSWFKQFSWETNPIWINEIIGNIFAYSGYPLENFSFNGTLEIIEMTSS